MTQQTQWQRLPGRRWWLAAAVVLAVVAFGAWWFGWPWWFDFADPQLLNELQAANLNPPHPVSANLNRPPATVPVLANGRLYLRDEERVWCLELRKPN